MVLTPQMERWNRMIIEQIKKEKEIGFDPEVPKDVPEGIIQLYNNLKKKILELGGDIKIVQQKKYIAFKAKTNFVDIEVLKKYVKCHINMKKGKLKDPNKKTRDVSNLGHFGTGDYEITINSLEDIDYFIFLAKQSYKLNS